MFCHYSGNMINIIVVLNRLKLTSKKTCRVSLVPDGQSSSFRDTVIYTFSDLPLWLKHYWVHTSEHPNSVLLCNVSYSKVPKQ